MIAATETSMKAQFWDCEVLAEARGQSQGVWKMRRRPENGHNHRNEHKCSFLWLEGGGGGQRAVARGLEAVEKARGL
jgi:hypothetical protein